MKVYGIPNCTTVKHARAWLDRHDIAYDFVDFKKSPPSRAQLGNWIGVLGWETVLNRRGTTFRKLPDSIQRAVNDPQSAIEVMLANPSAIKRPVIETKHGLLIGFDEAEYASRLGD